MSARLAARPRRFPSLLAGAFALALGACAAPEAETDPLAPKPIRPAGIEGLPRAVAIGNVVLAEQPSPAEISDLAHAGFATVINLRPSSEMAFDEGVLLHATRVHYVNIPFTPTTLEDQDVARFLSEIRTSLGKDEKVLVHCGSGNRAAALWAIYEITDLRLPPEKAVERARLAGLKSPELIGYIGQYSRRIGVEIGVGSGAATGTAASAAAGAADSKESGAQQ